MSDFSRTYEPLATLTVASLSINGKSVKYIDFGLTGPRTDKHAGFARMLSGHDGGYTRTSQLVRGNKVFNTRSWTALSKEELEQVEASLGVDIPQGTLLENIVFEGMDDFTKIEPTSRLVFPSRQNNGHGNQLILAVWEENGPCKTVGQRLADIHPEVSITDFVKTAQGKRGVMGFVYAQGKALVGDEVKLYAPVR